MSHPICLNLCFAKRVTELVRGKVTTTMVARDRAGNAKAPAAFHTLIPAEDQSMASERMTEVDAAAYKVAEAASDYKLAQHEAEFCRLNGGLNVIRERLFNATTAWESAMHEDSDG